mmetsp:Transcript_25098/g.82819  ORF Transcript_25098/g.82819 Transcript_25098/m.82819 type:complete len:189 (+) Transcript_25098:203-769(+)
MAEGVRVTARASFSRSTKYYISVGDASYGRCRKKWEDFEDLYDSLELRYGKLDISFPVYVTRKNNTKAEAVEKNRKNLEKFLEKLRAHPQLSHDSDVISFLHLVDVEENEDSDDGAPSLSLRDKPGPTPFTVESKPASACHVDEGDQADDETLPIDSNSTSNTLLPSSLEWKSTPQAAEPKNSIWIGR